MKKKIYTFGISSPIEETSKEVLGGKGAGLAQMVSMGLPVPCGMTIPTNACMDYLGGKLDMSDLMKQVLTNYSEMEANYGYVPLVSVRSGARVSMPGMMDTVLNVGMTDDNIYDWVDRLDTRAAWDSYRRLYQMYGNVVLGIDGAKLEEAFQKVFKYKYGAKELPVCEAQLTANHYKKAVENLRKIVDLPQTPEEQLQGAIEAVFNSWNNPRAKQYRKIHGYSDDWGTAVTIQSMVFGNMNNNSASGVLFTRDPATGAAGIIGEYLINAQGEDVVAGIRTPENISTMEGWDKKVYDQLMSIAANMEQVNRDMQDMEITIQDGKLYLLQTRTGKRSAKAAFKIAYDLYNEGVISKQEVLQRVTLDQYYTAIKPTIDADNSPAPDATGLAASNGLATGKAVFTSEEAVACTEDCILIREETTPEDLEGMAASVGVLTATGGFTSHAAVVARGLDKVCVTGCDDLDTAHKLLSVEDESGCGGFLGLEGAKITIDGVSGSIWVDKDIPVLSGAASEEVVFVKEAAFAKVADSDYIRVPADVEELRKGYRYMIDTTTISHLDYSQWKIGVNNIFKLAAGHDMTVVVKLDPEEADTSFYTKLFGQSPMKEMWNNKEARVGFLVAMAGDIGSNTIILSETLPLKGTSLPCVKTVNTLSELLSGGEVLLTEGFIEDIVGGDVALADLLSVMASAGRDVTPVKDGLTEMQTLTSALG